MHYSDEESIESRSISGNLLLIVTVTDWVIDGDLLQLPGYSQSLYVCLGFSIVNANENDGK